MEKSGENNISKVYCSKCDQIFSSRKKFEKHFDEHNRGVGCEVCPIDTVIEKFVNLFRRNPHNNLE